MTQNNVLYAFVALKAQETLPTGAVTSLTEGNVGLLNTGTAVLDDSVLLAGEAYKIVKMNGGVLQYSPEIKYEDILSYNTKVYVADTQYTGYLGYNGVSGDLSAETDTIYTPKVVVKGVATTYGNKSMMKEAAYKTGNVTTVYKADVAVGLVNSFILNMSREPEEYMKFSVISDNAGVALGDVDLVLGSKNITNVASEVAVGDFVKVGSAVNSAPVATSNIYEVVEILSTTTAVLDRPVLEATGTYTTGITLITETVAQGATVKFGIKFAGQARTNFVPGIWKNMVYDFDILRGSNFDNVLITETHAKQGINTDNNVAETQWFAAGNRGYGYRVDTLPVASQVTVEYSSTRYKSSTIKSKGQQFINVVGQSPASLMEAQTFGSVAFIDLLNTALGIS
jgi:hypothetical protein